MIKTNCMYMYQFQFFVCVCVKDVSCLSPLMPETVKLQKGLNLDHTC